MSWRRDEGRYGDRRDRDTRERQESRWSENRTRSPVWDMRRSDSKDRTRQSPSRDRPHRDRYNREDRERHERHDRKDRFDRQTDSKDRHGRSRDRYDRRDRDRDREHRRPQTNSYNAEPEDIPNPPSPPKISNDNMELSTHSGSPDRQSFIDDTNTTAQDMQYESTYDGSYDNIKQDTPSEDFVTSCGDWVCTCGSYNFKRRQICYRPYCRGVKSEGKLFTESGKDSETGITKRLLFRRLDALTNEEKILDEVKERCPKEIVDLITGITIGRESLTGASKCLAFLKFNSITDSAAAFAAFQALQPPLTIDGRFVLITYYNEAAKRPPKDYSYAMGQPNYSSTSALALSEADRVNAAAAVAQSAISAAQARQNKAWTPVTAPTFNTTTVQTAVNIPTGDGATVYTAPDVRTFLYDETSGYYYDPGSGLYYDGTTQYFFNNQTNQYMYWDANTSTYMAATQAQQNTDQPKLPAPPEATLENTITKEPEEKKKKEKDDKVKVAKKIAKDMERWARTLNQKKENAKSNIVMEQPLDMGASKGSADIGFSVLGGSGSKGSGPAMVMETPQQIREVSPPLDMEELLVKNQSEQCFETDEGIIDWARLTCLLCKRKFPSVEVLNKHKTMSDLHKQNLIEFRKKEDLLPQSNGYRDRAAERRMKFGEDEPIIRKRYEPPPPPSVMPSAPPPSVVDTIGGKMLQKMGWSQGKGLGKTEQGRIAPVEAEQRLGLAGLGQKKGIYTPTPGETYRDTVKKLMIARYKEVAGQDDS